MNLDALALGVLFGGFGVLVGAVFIFLVGRRGHADGGLGVWVAAAGLLAVEYTSEVTQLVPWAAIAAIVVLAGGGLFFDRVPARWSPLVFVPGASALALVPLNGIELQTRVALGLITLVACVGAADFERAHVSDGFALWLFPVTALVPALLIDGGTEPGWAFAGASAVMVVNVIPRPRARLGAPGIAALVGAYLWVGTLLSANRAVRMATLFAGLGFVVLEPLARNLGRIEARGRRRTGKRLQDRDAVIIATGVFGQAIIGFFAVRVTGHSRRSEYALLVLLAVLSAFTATARAFVPAANRRRTGDSRRRSGGRSRRGATWVRAVTGDRSHRSHRGRHRGRHRSRHGDGRDNV